MSLRTVVMVVVVWLAIAAGAMAAALSVLTSALDDAAGVVQSTVEISRLAREVEVDLLVYERAQDAIARTHAESELYSTLLDNARFPSSSATTEALRDEARAHVDRYLATTHAAGDVEAGAVELEAARDTIDRLVLATIGDAERTRAEAARLDDLGDAIAAAAAPLILAALVFLVFWLRSAVVRPTLDLSYAMDRFRKGDLTARAAPSGVRELHAMTTQFNAMGDALERQHEARLAHLAGVAHDLRNPLAALELSAALVDPERLGSNSAAARAFVIIRRQVGLLARMVNDLLDATRIEAGHLELKLEDKDVRSIAKHVAQLFLEMSAAHQIRLDLPAEALVVRCDPLRIEQTLTNLVSNAIKYSPRGGVVRIAGTRRGDRAEISVTDQGSGIAVADIDAIWEPFRRTGVSAGLIPGVGLGLWTARRIVDAHAGTISVESGIGKGSTFTVSLPLAPAPFTVPLGAQSPLAPSHG